MDFEKKWWQKPLRAVMLEFPASDIANLNLRKICKETADGDVNLLVAFAVSYYPGGTTFYQSKIAQHHPGLGKRDLLSEAIELAHSRNQKVIAFITSIWANREMYKSHPDWAQKKANDNITTWDEEFNSVAMCPNSPYREYFNSIVSEISDNYNLDGFYFDEVSFQSWCNCKYCQKKFKDDTGFKLPTVEDWKSDIFIKFIQWRYEQISNWREELYDLSKKEDFCVLFQNAIPFGILQANLPGIAGLPKITNFYQERFNVEWPVQLAHGNYLPKTVGIGEIIHFELYRVIVQEPLWWYSIVLRYGQSFSNNKQMLILNMMGESPFDLYGLPEKEIRLSVAEILANGGSPLFSRYYPDQVDQEAWDKVYNVFRESKILDPYLTSRESIKYAAVLFSQKTSDFYDQEVQNPAHLSELKGISKALIQNQTLFDIINEDNLNNLDQYEVLIIPNASYLSNSTKESIRNYVRNGGGLVATYETGMFDEFGDRTTENDFAELFGISYINEEYKFKGFDVYMKMSNIKDISDDIRNGKLVPTGGVQLNLKAIKAKIIAEEISGSKVHYGPLGKDVGSPTVLINQSFGKGRVVYFSIPIGNRYKEFGILDHFKLINSAVKWAARKTAPIVIENAPRTLSMTAFIQTGINRQIIHLVNSMRDEISQPILELCTCKGVKLISKSKKKPINVMEAGKLKLEWLFNGKELIVKIPDFDDSIVIVIEY